MSDEQLDTSDLSPLLRRATAAKGKALTEKERKKLQALEADLRKREQELEAIQRKHDESSLSDDQAKVRRRPKPEDYGLTISDIRSAERAIKKGTRYNRLLSWFLYALAIMGAVVAWRAFNGLLAFVVFFWFLGMGLNASDSKRLTKLWNYKQRRLIDVYYQFEMAWWPHFRRLERASFEFWKSLSRRDFVVEIGNLFRTDGFEIEAGGGSSGHGVDLLMSKGGRRAVVKCSQSENPASPSVVRELYATLTAAGAHNAILVCTGGFTAGVYSFVRGKPVQLVDMDGILALQNLTVETYGFYGPNSNQ